MQIWRKIRKLPNSGLLLVIMLLVIKR